MSRTINDFADLLEAFLDKRLSNVFVGAIGRIEKFSSTLMTADVKVLLKEENILKSVGKAKAYKDFPVIPDCPVQFLYSGGFFIRPEYKRGDLVMLSFTNHSNEFAKKGLSYPKSENKFGLQNAIVIGGILRTGMVIPDFTKTGLLIGNLTELVRIATGKISLKTSGKIALANNAQSFDSIFSDLIDAISAATTIGGPTNQAMDGATQTALAAIKTRALALLGAV